MVYQHTHTHTDTHTQAWDDWMEKSADMLLVLDCHQDWCGQCETLQPTFLRIYMDVGAGGRTRAGGAMP